jgi:hypothetical protein
VNPPLPPTPQPAPSQEVDLRPGDTLHLTLRVLAGDVPAAVRIRRSLKVLLRTLGLRVVRLTRVQETKEGDKSDG